MISKILRVLRVEAQALVDCAERIEKNKQVAEAFEKAVGTMQHSLKNGGKIVVTGVGKSGKVAQKISSTLCSTGSLAVFLHAGEGLHGDLGVVRSGDVVLALSQTGNTEELLNLLPSVKSLGVPILGLGGNSRSRLATLCDAWMDIQVAEEACPHNLAPTTSTTLALAVGDALAIALMESQGFDSNAFAQNHPGGSLGKRLNLKVSDLMHTQDAVAVVGPEATMDEVVVVLTEKKLGVVLIEEKGLLTGIITDGDLRRALQHREKFFDFQAKDVMTRNPVTLTPDKPARFALELMENRPSQIAVLPVVNQQGGWVGVIRLHDLVKEF